MDWTGVLPAFLRSSTMRTLWLFAASVLHSCCNALNMEDMLGTRCVGCNAKLNRALFDIIMFVSVLMSVGVEWLFVCVLALSASAKVA